MNIELDYSKKITAKQCDDKTRKNAVNAYVQFIQQHSWVSVKDGLPPIGDELCCVAMYDDMASYGMAGEVMNTTWFCKHFKKKGWTHWLLLPPRPSDINNMMEHLFKGTPIERD